MAGTTNTTPKKRKVRYSDTSLCAALKASGGMVYMAAAKLGCAPSSIYDRINTSEKVKSAIDDARGEMLDLAETALKESVRANEGWAVCFTLKTIGKDRGYFEKSRNEISGPNGTDISVRSFNYGESVAPLKPLQSSQDET